MAFRNAFQPSIVSPILALTLGLASQGAFAQTANDLVCIECVNESDLAKDAVTSARIRDGSVGFRDLDSAVNEAVAKLQSQMTALIGQVAAQQAQMAALQGQVAALQAQSGFVSDLAAFITVDEVGTDLDGDGTIDPATELLPRMLFEGVNLQVVNGDLSEATNSLNGLGNLIVGYNEPRTGGGFVCSDGRFDNQFDCEAGGHLWARNHKSGSHNLVVGGANAYSRTGGAVFGALNVVNRQSAAVTGGVRNTASGLYASVSGGIENAAGGLLSSVSGGQLNTAKGNASSVSGGIASIASGNSSSVSGGDGNTASGDFSSISGGEDNTASGRKSSVSGGQFNRATGNASSVSGGVANTASGLSASVNGGDENTASGDFSSVSGGEDNTASGSKSSISGGNFRSATGSHNWAAGGLFEFN